MVELNLFDDIETHASKVLICPLDQESQLHALGLLQSIRDSGISAEIYPDITKIKKQMKYAGNRGVDYTILIGSQEIEETKYTLKDMQTGKQEKLSIESIIEKIK